MSLRYKTFVLYPKTFKALAMEVDFFDTVNSELFCIIQVKLFSKKTENIMNLKTLIFSFFLMITPLIQAQDRCDISFNNTAVCANIDWIYGPYLDQYSSAKISLTANTNVKSIKVIPWMVMSGHEHGSRPIVLTKTGDYEYLVEKAYFMGGMVGTWYFKVQLFNQQNALLEENRYLIQFK